MNLFETKLPMPSRQEAQIVLKFDLKDFFEIEIRIHRMLRKESRKRESAVRALRSAARSNSGANRVELVDKLWAITPGSFSAGLCACVRESLRSAAERYLISSGERACCTVSRPTSTYQ